MSEYKEEIADIEGKKKYSFSSGVLKLNGEIIKDVCMGAGCLYINWED